MSSRPTLTRDLSKETIVTIRSTSSSTNTSSSSGSKPRSHHAKSRRLTAQPRPLKPLAAKTSEITKRWQPLSSVTSTALQKAVRSPKIQGCPVCGQPTCQLPTHQKSASVLQKKGEAPAVGPNSVEVTDEAYKSSYAYHLSQTYIQPGLGHGRIDPFHNLPLSGPLDTPRSHSLFHYYFSFETKQGFQLPSVPHVTEDLILNPFFIMAMQDPTVCLSVLALATAMHPTNRNLPPDAVGALEYSGQAMSLARKANIAGNLPSDELIVSQGFLWATSMIILDKSAMTGFAENVHTLVQARGGLRGLGFQGRVEQFIRWLEARYCTLAHVRCRYQDAPDPSASLLTRISSRKYGSFWETGKAAKILSRDVLEACQATCRKIEVAEDTIANGMTMSTLLWLMGKILFQVNVRSQVFEQHDGKGTFNECVILANELALLFAVDNIVKQRNALISQTQPLLISLKKLVQQFPRLLNGSHGTIELLTWVLFMVVMVPHDFVGKDWARMLLSRVVQRIREKDADWRFRIWRSMAKFTWSNRKNQKYFDDVCSEISQEIEAKID